jgi:hypothetical protein
MAGLLVVGDADAAAAVAVGDDSKLHSPHLRMLSIASSATSHAASSVDKSVERIAEPPH